MYIELSFLAYLIDRVFGEFSFIKFYKHPVVFMGDFIKWFESKYYEDSIKRGVLLTFSLVSLVFTITFLIDSLIDNIFITALIASTALASKSLYDSVKDILINPNHIKYLVSRDTENLTQSEINKAAIETYAENLNDGVIAPLFYLLFFGIVGVFLYKAVNTLDSMVGYRNKRYENFGKFSAKLDDILNYIPARITALLIAILFRSYKALCGFPLYGRLHDSLNAGYSISAMALALHIKLGGPTSYFGTIKSKPYFGDGSDTIVKDDLKRALSFQIRVDIFLLFLGIITLINI
jgi:adenosylcobinamide-phosphate synthase